MFLMKSLDIVKTLTEQSRTKKRGVSVPCGVRADKSFSWRVIQITGGTSRNLLRQILSGGETGCSLVHIFHFVNRVLLPFHILCAS